MLTNVYTYITLFNLLLTVAGILGGMRAWRVGFQRTANEVQGKVIDALETRINILNDQVKDLSNQNGRLTQIIETICDALRSRGLIISIDGKMITISDGKDVHVLKMTGSP